MNIINTLKSEYLAIKYLNFAEKFQSNINITKDYFYFISTKDFGKQPILHPREGVHFTRLFTPQAGLIGELDYRGKKISVAPTIEQCLLSIASCDYVIDEEPYHIYLTHDKSKAYQAVNTDPLVCEYYLFNPARFMRVDTLTNQQSEFIKARQRELTLILSKNGYADEEKLLFKGKFLDEIRDFMDWVDYKGVYDDEEK